MTAIHACDHINSIQPTENFRIPFSENQNVNECTSSVPQERKRPLKPRFPVQTGRLALVYPALLRPLDPTPEGDSSRVGERL